MFGAWVIPLAVTLIFSLYSWFIDNKDHIEFLSTAQYFIHGNGFVNPVKSVFTVEAPSPIPAFAYRGALYPLLLALFLKISPHLLNLKILNACLASLAPLLTFLVSRKIMNEKAAFLGVLLFFTSPGWIFVVQTPWSEPLICILWLIPLACCMSLKPGWGQSLLTGLAAGLAWTVKPQLGFFVPLLGLNLLATTGWKPFIRNRFYWGTALTYFIFTFSIKLIYHQATGTWPYQAYAAWLGVLRNRDVLMVNVPESGSVIHFVFTNIHSLFLSWIRNVATFARVFLSGYYSVLIFLFLPAILSGFKKNRNQSVPFFLSISVVALTALNWFLWSITDATRSYLLPMLLLHLLCMVYAQKWIDRYFKQLLVVFCLLFVPWMAWRFGAQREAYLHDPRAKDFPVLAEHYAPFCSQWDNRILAAYNGWNYHVICGNPVVILPFDLDNEAHTNTFIDKEKVTSILAPEPYPSFEFLHHFNRLQLIDTFTFHNMPLMRLYHTSLEFYPLRLKPVPPLYFLVEEEIRRIEKLNPGHENQD